MPLSETFSLPQPRQIPDEKLPSGEPPGYRLPLMAFLLRWWQSFVHALSLGGGAKNDGWVEPGNEITRAILSGAVTGLPMLRAEAVELPEIMALGLPLVTEAPGEVLEEPAAAEQQREAPATRTRKRRGHRAA